MKRVFDILISLAAGIFLLPLFLIIAVIIRWRMGRPVFYRQRRAGLHGKPFCLVKFRTMLDEYDSAGSVRSDDARLTGLGRTLRSASIDELPELWNVLRGEMSLVGPRPLLMEYLPLYTREQMRRHDVRPGITGWAQVNGRNSLTWEDRFAFDVWYVENHSFWLDIKILSMTLLKVLRREGISAPDHATMAKFTGSDGS